MRGLALAVTTREAPSAIVEPMDASRTLALFREAVLDLSDHASEENARRYLAASRLLERHRNESAATKPVARKALKAA